jgi:hypothetical protein
MDVMGFLCVSLGSSTIQLHDTLGSRRISVHRLVSVFKMVAVFQSTMEQQCSAEFLVGNILNTKDIHKEMFPLYGGKCLLHKAVHNWVQKFSQGRSKVTYVARSYGEVAERTFKTSMLQVLTHW